MVVRACDPGARRLWWCMHAIPGLGGCGGACMQSWGWEVMVVHAYNPGAGRLWGCMHAIPGLGGYGGACL